VDRKRLELTEFVYVESGLGDRTIQQAIESYRQQPPEVDRWQLPPMEPDVA
jgi:hypothetical protein